MKLAQSRITQQGRVSIPAEVRRRLGVVPGSVIDWEMEGEKIVVRRACKFSSLAIHRAVFGDEAPRSVTVEDMDRAIGERLKDKHARR